MLVNTLLRQHVGADACKRTTAGDVQVENTMRWRPVKDEEGNEVRDELGEIKRESNARMVKWSDGR